MTIPDPVYLTLPEEPITKDIVLTITDGEAAGLGFIRESEAAPGSQSWLRDSSSNGNRYTYPEVWLFVLEGGGTRLQVSTPSATAPYPFPWKEQINGTVVDSTGKIIPLEIIVRQANRINEMGIITWEE